MNNKSQKDNTGAGDFPSLQDLDDEAEMKTPTEIYGELIAFGELILTIAAVDVLALKQGLASAKYKAGKKAREQDFPVDNQDIIYRETPAEAGAINLHISLGRKGAIQVLRTFLPDSEI